MASPLTFEQLKSQAEAQDPFRKAFATEGQALSEYGAGLAGLAKRGVEWAGEEAGAFATGASNLFSDIKGSLVNPLSTPSSSEAYSNATGLNKRNTLVAKRFIQKMEESGVDVSDPKAVFKFIDENHDAFLDLPSSLKSTLKMFVNGKQSQKQFVSDVVGVKDAINNAPKEWREPPAINRSVPIEEAGTPSPARTPAKSEPVATPTTAPSKDGGASLPDEGDKKPKPVAEATTEPVSAPEPVHHYTEQGALRDAPHAYSARYDKDLGYVPRAIPADEATRLEMIEARAKENVRREYAGKSTDEVLAHYAKKYNRPDYMPASMKEKEGTSSLPTPADGMSPYSIEAYRAKKKEAMQGKIGSTEASTRTDD